MRIKRGAFRRRDPNGPPPGSQWVWLTREMINSEAWRAMPLASRRIVDRIGLEHHAHGGARNGSLTVTYDNFVDYGVSSRRAVAFGIRAAVELGFIDVTERGRRSYGGSHRPSSYGLTWMPLAGQRFASNKWQAIATRVDADAAVERARTKVTVVKGVSRDLRAATA